MRCQSPSMADCIDKHLDWQIFADRNAILLLRSSGPCPYGVRGGQKKKKKRRNEQKLKASKSPQTLLWLVLYYGVLCTDVPSVCTPYGVYSSLMDSASQRKRVSIFASSTEQMREQSRAWINQAHSLLRP